MIALLCTAIAAAGVVEDGAEAFDDGRLDDAISIWSGVAEKGRRPSGILSYNLGTAWYRKGDWPRSVAHLRAAARLRPRDGAVHHNLALARAELGAVPAPAPLPASWMSVATPGEIGVLGLLLTLLGSAAIGLGRLSSRRGQLPGGVLLVVGVAIGGIAAWGAHALAAHPIAVVVDTGAVLRDAASVNAGERFRLPPGAEVRVERRYGDFLLVEDGRARRGWLAVGTTEVPW